MPNPLAHKKWITLFSVILLVVIALGTTTPALAHWLGVPHRTKTVTITVCKVVLQSCQYVESKGEYRYHTVEDWSCSNESKPWQKYPSHGGACPPGQDHWERDESEQTTVIDLDPATIEGTLQNCTSSNGWCGVTPPTLELSAFEPLTGYNITRIEWTRNGAEFACEDGAASCSIPLLEGDNNFTYWAHSSWGDTSDRGTLNARVDTIPPAVTLSVTGTSGWNGWYKSSIQVMADVSDATSGVATFEVAVNGGGYQPYTRLTPIPFNYDGVHALQFRASDNAGNIFESPVQNFYVDTTPPTVNLRGSWQLGKNVPYDAIDEGSGLAVLRVVIEDEDEKFGKVTWDENVSGTMYSQDIDWNGKFKDGTVAPPGTYLVWIKVSDVAGNEHFELAKIIVPEPNYVGPVALPTDGPVVTVAPPAELSQSLDIPSLATPPPGSSGGTGTTTYSLTSTSGTAGGSTGTSLLGVSGGTTSTSQTSLPWLPIAAAAVLGTSAVVAASTLKRTDPQGEQNQTTFPKNPIPTSLFPGPAGGVKSIPSSQSGGGSTGSRENPGGGGEHPKSGGTVGNGGAVVSLKLKDPPPPKEDEKTDSAITEIEETGKILIAIDPPQPAPVVYPDIETLRVSQTKNDAIVANGFADAAAADAATAEKRAQELAEIAAQNPTPQALTNKANAADAAAQAAVDAADQKVIAVRADVVAQDAVVNVINDAQVNLSNAQEQAIAANGFADAAAANAAAAERRAQELAEIAAQNPTAENLLNKAAAADEAADAAYAAARAKVAAATADAGVEGAAQNLQNAIASKTPLPPKPASALDNFDKGLSIAGIVTGLVSITGAVMEQKGIPGGQFVSGLGTVTGSLVDAGSLVTGTAKLVQAISAGAKLPSAGVLGKIGGVFAIVAGGATVWFEGKKVLADLKDDGELTQSGKASAVNAVGGFLTMAGGVCMFIPGGQLVGGILLAAGGVASGIAWYIENKEKVDAWVKNAPQAMATAASNVANAVKNTVSKAVNTAKDTVKKVADTVKNTVNKAVNTVKNTVNNVVNTVKSTVSNAVNTVKNTVSNVVNTVKNTVSNAVNTVKNTVSNVVNTVKNTVSNVVNTVKNTVNNATQTVAKVTQTVSKAVSNATQTVSKAVNTVTQKAASTVKSVTNTISNWFKKKP